MVSNNLAKVWTLRKVGVEGRHCCRTPTVMQYHSAGARITTDTARFIDGGWITFRGQLGELGPHIVRNPVVEFDFAAVRV